MDYQFQELEADSPFAQVVLGWVVDEWGLQPGQSEADLLERLLAHEDCPPTQVALLNSRPIGALAFTRHAQDGAVGELLWIDVLYVAREHRGQGVGSRLLTLGERLAAHHAPDLSAYTSVPEFYARRGWQLVETRDDGNCVMTRVVPQRPPA